MRSISKLNEEIINESATQLMIKALEDLETSWNYVSKLWYDSEEVEDKMMKANTVYPFGNKQMEDLDMKTWIKTCIKSLKNK